MTNRTATSRREFVRLASSLAGAFAIGCGADGKDEAPAAPTATDPTGCAPRTVDGWLVPSNPDVHLPHLGGAPDTPAGWSLAVFVDGLVPGAHLDPLGKPGALDVGVPGMFFDPELPAARFVTLLVAVLDTVASKLVPGATLGTLPPERREEAVDKVMEEELLGFAAQLVKLGYYSSTTAACLLGYPGPNAGYIAHPSFSFRAPMSTELTTDGNYP